MKVPKNANVRMTPKFLKKFSYPSAIVQASPGYQAITSRNNDQVRIVVEGETGASLRTCLSSYPEFKMIGGSSKLKKRVCLKDYHQLDPSLS